MLVFDLLHFCINIETDSTKTTVKEARTHRQTHSSVLLYLIILI
jgi:hypothetical protein